VGHTRIFDLNLPTEFAYYFVCPEATADRPKIRAFREWLLAEAHREMADQLTAEVL